jgi:ParB family chromosome partitioning protein
MTQKKRGLGRGLESLLSPNFDTAAAPASELIELAIDTLRPGRYQPRRDIDTEALEALAQSIRAQGIVQPLVVRAAGEAYEIIAGERRWRAARLAALTTVPAVIRELTDETAMAVTLIENIQREDLNPLEESVALRRLIDECGLTHAACAEAIGRSRAAVSNLLRLADLNADVRDHLWEGALEMGHARALLALTGEAQSRSRIRSSPEACPYARPKRWFVPLPPGRPRARRRRRAMPAYNRPKPTWPGAWPPACASNPIAAAAAGSLSAFAVLRNSLRWSPGSMLKMGFWRRGARGMRKR